MSAELTVTIDGTQYPLNTCFWVRMNADGCASGSLRPDLIDDLIATPLQAQRVWSPTKRERAVDDRRGIRHELISPDQFEPVALCLRGKCQHSGLGRPVKDFTLPGKDAAS